MSAQSDLRTLDITEPGLWRLPVARWLLAVGWGLAAVGFLGPWIAHPAAALALSGAEMAEFVKFLPQVLDGSLGITRQFFYLPPFTVVISVALLIGSPRLAYRGLSQAVVLLLAAALSLQILPPAWSPASMLASEFRAQAIALGGSWLLLASFWLWGRLPSWLPGAVSAVLSLVAIVLSLWQFLLAKPALDKVYGALPAAGWGLWLCVAGLATMAAVGGFIALPAHSRAGERHAGS